MPALAASAIDVSDGLVADLGHIAEASRVRIVVEAARIPRSRALKALWGDGAKAIVRAATAGDDYQIAFTAAPARAAELAAAALRTKTRITRIGSVQKGLGVILLGEDGRAIPVSRAGFAHFEAVRKR